MKRPILYCALSFSIGIAAANIAVPFLYLATLCSFSILLAVILRKNNILSHVFLYLALALFGAAYSQNYNILPIDHVANLATDTGRKIVLTGVVTDDPVVKKTFYGSDKISFVLEVRGVKHDSVEESASGLVKADIYTSGRVKPPAPGDEIIMEGTLSKPEGLKNPGLFEYSRYLWIKNIYAVFSVNEKGRVEVVNSDRIGPLMERAYSVRRNIRDAIKRYTDRRYSAFLNAILIGERAELDSSVTEDFVKTGTVHVIAISGLNIALVAGIFLAIFRIFRIKKKLNLALASLAIVFYCFVAGSSPPVVRATIVFVIISFGYIIDRESDILNSLSMAAFLILLANPKEILDPSFQLSFGSVISIVLFAPKVEELFGKRSNFVTKSAAVSIAASIGVFPIVARYFNIVSPVSVLANLVIVPALFVLTVASFIFLFFNMIGAAFFLGWMGAALSILTGVTFYINHLFAQIPLSYVRIPSPSAFFICGYYAFLGYMLFTKNRKHIPIVALIALNMLVWTQDLGYNSREMKITFLDVGKGDSAIVQFPGRGTMLVDGGSGGEEGITDSGKSIVAPYLWNSGIRRLDAIVVTHFHEDHLGGLLYILENFEVGCVIDNGQPSSGDLPLYEKYTGIIKRKKIRRLVVGDRDEITGFGSAKIIILNPKRDVRDMNGNDSSIVMRIAYNNFSALFCADITSRAMERLLPYGDSLKADVMKMPHHGGDIGDRITAKRFFGLISPEISVTSTGGRYRFSKISESTKRLMDSLELTNYETKDSGAVSVISDGVSFKVSAFRQKN